MSPSRITCAVCRDVIGVYDPFVWYLPDGTVIDGERGGPPNDVEGNPAAALALHRSCAERAKRERRLLGFDRAASAPPR